MDPTLLLRDPGHDHTSGSRQFFGPGAPPCADPDWLSTPSAPQTPCPAPSPTLLDPQLSPAPALAGPGPAPQHGDGDTSAAGGAAPGRARTGAVLHGPPAPFSRAGPGRRLLPAEPAGPAPQTPSGPTPYGPASPSPHLSAAPALPGGPRSTGPGRACPRPSVCPSVRPSSRAPVCPAVGARPPAARPGWASGSRRGGGWAGPGRGGRGREGEREGQQEIT